MLHNNLVRFCNVAVNFHLFFLDADNKIPFTLFPLRSGDIL